MRPEPVPGPLTWCPDCGWQEGAAKHIEVLDETYYQDTPINDVGTYEKLTFPCGCDPDEWDEDDWDEPSLGEQASVGWRCGHCGMIHGGNFAAAEECCPGVIKVPADHKLTFTNGRSFVARNQSRIYMKETQQYTITDPEGRVVEKV